MPPTGKWRCDGRQSFVSQFRSHAVCAASSRRVESGTRDYKEEPLNRGPGPLAGHWGLSVSPLANPARCISS